MKKILSLLLLLTLFSIPAFAEGADISYVQNPMDISVPLNVPLDDLRLPETVRIITDDDTALSVDVEWSQPSAADSSKPGLISYSGTLMLPTDGSLTNSKKLQPQARIIILSQGAKSIVEVESLKDLSVAFGTLQSALILQPSVKVTMADGSEALLPVDWYRNPNYDSQIADSYVFTGSILLPSDGSVSNMNGVTPEINVLVQGKEVETVYTVRELEGIPAMTVPFDTPLEELRFPSSMLVTLNDGKTLPINLKWDMTADYNPQMPGEYRFEASLDLPEDNSIENPDDLKPYILVTVLSQETKDIASISALPEIRGTIGQAEDSLNMPKEVEVTLSDNTKLMLPILWTTKYDPELSEQTLFGVVELPETIKNPSNLIVSQVIRLEVSSTSPVTAEAGPEKTAGIPPYLLWGIPVLVVLGVILTFIIISSKNHHDLDPEDELPEDEDRGPIYRP